MCRHLNNKKRPCHNGNKRDSRRHSQNIQPQKIKRSYTHKCNLCGERFAEGPVFREHVRSCNKIHEEIRIANKNIVNNINGNRDGQPLICSKSFRKTVLKECKNYENNLIIKSEMGAMHANKNSVNKIKNTKWNPKQVKSIKNRPVRSLRTCDVCKKQFTEGPIFREHIRSCNEIHEKIRIANKHIIVTKLAGNTGHLVKGSKNFRKMVLRQCKNCVDDNPIERHYQSLQLCNKCGLNMQFICAKCRKTSDKHKQMSHHLETTCNTGEKLQCSKCNYKSTCRQSTLKHYNTLHARDEIIYCSVCSSTYQDLQGYMQHLAKCNGYKKILEL